MDWWPILVLLVVLAGAAYGVYVLVRDSSKKNILRKKKKIKRNIISNKEIDDKLQYLHARVRQPPTAVSDCYCLPVELKNEIWDTNYSQPSLQKAANHIGYFLGLLNSVKVTIGIESSEYMLSGVGEAADAQKVGLYKVRGGFQREIQLTKKFRFELKHLMAILAHESTHNYLYQHGIELPNESENELLTDVAASYLGLGGLLYGGYKPIQWTTYSHNVPNSLGSTVHTITIGYLSQSGVAYAVVQAAKIRCIENLASPLPEAESKDVALFFRNIKREIEEIKREQAKTVTKLNKEIEKAESMYGEIVNRLHSHHMRKTKVSKSDSHKLVEVANLISQGELYRKLQRVKSDCNNFVREADNDKEKLYKLTTKSWDIYEIIRRWHRIVNRNMTK